MAAPGSGGIDQVEDGSFEQFHCVAKTADIVSFLPDPTLVIDKKGMVISWNRAIEDLTGIKAEDILGKGNYEYAVPFYGFRRPILADLVLHPDKDTEAKYMSLRRDGMTLTCEVFITSLQQNGSYLWAKAAPLYDSSGNIIGAIESLRDITERKRSEEATKESEAKFRLLFERSADAMFLLDGEKFIDCNKAAMDLMKCSDKEELLNLHPSQTAPERQPDGRLSFEKAEEMMRTAYEKGTHRFEWVRRRKNGEEFPVVATLTAIQGDRQILHLIIKDITEKKRVEDALKESESKYRTIFENTGAATAIIEEDTTISLANAKFEKLTGYSEEELEGKKKWIDFVDKTDLEKMLKYYSRKVVDRDSEDHDPTPRSYEFRLVDKVGRVKDILSTVDAIPGTKKSVISLLDISRLKRAEVAHKETIRFLQHLIDAIPNSIFYKDVNGIYQGCNSAFEKFLGLNKEDIIGKSVYDLFPIDLADRYNKMDQALFDRPGSEVHESSLVYVDDTVHDVVFNKATYTDANGRLSGLVGVVLDITKRKRAEEALRESEEKYRNLVERANDGIIIIQDGLIKYANSQSGMIWDSTVEEILGKSFTDYIYPDELPSIVERYRRRMANEYVEPIYETTLRRKDGSKIFVELNAGLITFLGEPADLVIIRDITERKQAEEALRKSEQSYRLLAENVTDVIWTMNLNMRFVYISPSNARMTGFSAEESMAMTLDEILTPGSFEIAVQTLAEELENEKIQGLDKYRSRTVELEENCKDGRTIWVEVKTSFIRDQKGQPVGIQGISRDITDRKKAENALQDTKEYLNQIINSIGDPIFVKDLEHRFVLVNSALCVLAGRPREELLGMSDFDLFPKEQADIFWKLDEQVFEKGEENVNEEEITDAQGDVRTSITKRTVFEDKDGNKHIIGVIRDISERKQMEKELRLSRDNLRQRVRARTADLEAKNSEMERFIYTVSHDLRTPLISMSGFLGFLKADAEKGDMKRMDSDLQIVSEAVKKMDRLLLDTLELSRIGRIVNPPENVPFKEIVSEALAQSWAKIRSKNVRVTVEEDFPMVQADRMRIVEVLVNLIENSVKYMGNQPQPEIDIGKRPDGEHTVFFVRDNGFGIDQSEHSKVFDLFYKVDKKSEGSGAGLAIVKKIVEVHRGRIWIESDLGKGCTVCFTIPNARNAPDILNNCELNGGKLNGGELNSGELNSGELNSGELNSGELNSGELNDNDKNYCGVNANFEEP